MNPKSVYDLFVRSVEAFTERSIQEIRNTPVCRSRREHEQKHGSFRLTSWYPLIGRGNVLRDRGTSRDEIEAEFEQNLRK